MQKVRENNEKSLEKGDQQRSMIVMYAVTLNLVPKISIHFGCLHNSTKQSCYSPPFDNN